MAIHITPRQRRERLLKRAMLSMLILSVLVVLAMYRAATSGQKGIGADIPGVAENLESEAIVSDGLGSIATAVDGSTTSAATTTVATTTMTTTTEENTTTTTVSTEKTLYTQNNAVISAENLETRFQLGERWLNWCQEETGVFLWQSDDMGEIKETFYGCTLEGVFGLFSEEIGYPYSMVKLRSDGIWCIALGEDEQDWLVCVAADHQSFPRGSLVRTSLGFGIVCDTGGFTLWEHGSRWFDIAVANNDWHGGESTYNVFNPTPSE